MAIGTAGLFIFPWDFADEGLDRVLAEVADLGITRLYLASLYHAGFFLHPHSPVRQVHMLEDGVAYFHPTPARYAGALAPEVASLCRTVDWFGRVSEAAAARGLETCAWTVCLHNTRLGRLHPECTVHNAFGNSYPHALTPAHPRVRAYLRGLVGDLAARYPVCSLLLEAANYRGRAHGGSWVSGHHHERDGVWLRPLERALIDLSFNPADVATGQDRGLDVEALRRAVRGHLERYFALAPSPPAGLPESLEQFCAAVPALDAYRGCLRRSEESLLAELGPEARAHGVRLEGSGSPAYDVVLCGAYGEGPEGVAALTRRARAGLAAHQQLNVALRMGFNTPGLGQPIVDQTGMCLVVRAAADSGADAVTFYNYSEAPRRSIEWIGPALRGIGFTPRAPGP